MKELRRFGLTLGSAVAVMFGLVLPSLWGYAFPVWPWVASVPIVGLSVVRVSWLRPVYVAWMTIVHFVNWLISRTTLAFVYYAAVVPIGLVMRALGRDPMRRRFEDAHSYRVPSEAPDRNHLERPF